jgi:hypothetical protein
MRITSGGNVLIGTSTEIASRFKMTILNQSSSGAGIYIDARNTSDAAYISSSPSIYYHYYADNQSVIKFYVLNNGDVRNANNSYGAISDERIKENIVDASPKLSDLLKVKIRNYNLIDDDNKTKQIGVIAQELEKIFPGMVSEEYQKVTDTTIKTVKYSVFVPMLIKAIQEQQAQIEELRKIISEK